MANITINYEPANVRVSDERNTVPGALCKIVKLYASDDDAGYLVIPKEGPSPDCWLGTAVAVESALWDSLDEAARAGARGESGSINVVLDEEDI